MLLNESSRKPAENRNARASGYDRARAKPTSAPPQLIASTNAVAGPPAEDTAAALEEDPREQRSCGVGREQHRVRRAGVTVSEVVREARHLRLIAVADKEGGAPRQRDHDGQRRDLADLADGLDDVAETADSALRRRPVPAKVATVRRRNEPEDERQVENRVEEDAARRSEPEHDEAPDRRPDEDPEVARGRSEPHGAR